MCGSRILGRIGLEQYYCWDCCAQFNYTGSHLRAYEIADDGTLVPQSSALDPQETPAGPVGVLGTARREEVSRW